MEGVSTLTWTGVLEPAQLGVTHRVVVALPWQVHRFFAANRRSVGASLRASCRRASSSSALGRHLGAGIARGHRTVEPTHTAADVGEPG
jgi:hypothetical protein